MYPTKGLVTFTIKKEKGKLALTCYKPYEGYEVHGIEPEDLYKEMDKLAFVFNNHLKMGILFEVE